MTASSHNFSESHTYDDIVRAHAADPQSINWNAGQLAQLVLGKHDMRSFQFLLDCVDFKWRYAVTDVTRSCVNVTGYWFDECETCKKGRLSRSSNEDDRWLKEAFAFHYDVFCRVIECDRLLEHGRFVHDMMFTMARYTVALAPIVYARLQPRHWIDMIQGANAYIPSVYVASNIKHYAPDVIARLDVEFCKSTDKEGVFFIDRYPWRIESHTRKMLNPIVCAIRLTEVAMALAPLGLPIYVLLHIIECLPGFADCIDTFTAYQRVARIQTIVNLAKHAVYRSTIAGTSKVLKL